MAAKKKSSKKKKEEFTSFKPSLSPEVTQEIVAIGLFGFVILLLFAIFNFGGPLPATIFTYLRMGFGFAAYLLPIILGILAYMMFLPDKYEIKANNYLGFAGVLISLSGLFHVVVAQPNALDAAQQGMNGGFVGYFLQNLALTILNVPAAFTTLLILLVVSMITASNLRLRDMLKALMEMIRGKGADQDLQINEAVGGPQINNKLPIRGTIGGGNAKPAQVQEALTVVSDEDWTPPSLELVQETTSKANAGNVKENAATIQQTLSSFGIEVAMGEVNIGPTVTQYTLKPQSGVKLNKITALEHNLALSLAAHPIRIEAPIPGKSAVGVEIPNKSSAMVRLRDLMVAPEIKKETSSLTFVLGRDVSGEPAAADLAKMPHLLIAGATGSGKSVMINTLITSLLYRNSPSNLKLILVDPKRVELSLYKDIPHLLTPVIVEPEKCISALKWGVAEMERRYKLFAEEGKRNISEYNAAKKDEAMPYIVIIIDELADLMALAASDVEGLIVRLAQMARATGIHLVLATQRPSVDVITGLIKANIPARIAFSVASQFDSRTILDQSGAEKLLGKGDMLFSSPEFIKPRRIQGVYLDEKEVRGVTDYLREARAPQYNDEILNQQVRIGGGRGGSSDFSEPDDDLFNEAAETVIRSGKASASLLQRRLRVGYARAARLLDLLEERGVVGPADGARPRDVLVGSLSDIGGGGGDEPDMRMPDEYEE